jgi:hypothetical protein
MNILADSSLGDLSASEREQLSTGKKLIAKMIQLLKEIEYLMWKRSIPGHFLKYCFYLLCCPCVCLPRCIFCCMDRTSHHLTRTGGRDERAWKPIRVLETHFQHRERHLKRRKSLSELPNFSLSRILRRKERQCDQRQCLLLTKLPTEIRLEIFGFVLNNEPFLHVTPYTSRRWKKGRGRIVVADCFVSENGCWRYLKPNEFTLDTLANEDPCMGGKILPWAPQHRRCLEASEVPRRPYHRPMKYKRDDHGEDSHLPFLPLLRTCRRM